MLHIMNQRSSIQKLTFCALLLLSSYSFGQTNPAFIDSLFYAKNGLQNKFPNVGTSIGIVQNGKANFYSLGTISRTSNQKINKNTIFEIGSNTKLFTALLLAIEITKGKILDSAFIDTYLPKGATLKAALQNKIRITDLASYSSGLPTLHGDKFDSLILEKDVLQPYQHIDKKYLYNILNNTSEAPNYGKYEYSNFNYGLLGAILENFKRKTYAELLKKNIYTPLKFKNTWTGAVNSNNKVSGYHQDKEVGYLQLDALNPAGAIKSDAEDMLNFLKYQLSPQESALSKAIALTQRIFVTDGISLGLGWHIIEYEKDKPFYVMQGDTIGNSSLLYFDKKMNTGIVILINHSNHDLTGIILDYLLKKINGNPK